MRTIRAFARITRKQITPRYLVDGEGNLILTQSGAAILIDGTET